MLGLTLKYLSSGVYNAIDTQDEVLARLKFLCSISKGEKINTKHLTRQPNTYFTALSRTLIYPDNRSNTLAFVRSVIYRSLEILENEKNAEVAKRIYLDLSQARIGIENLKDTYVEDAKFVCDLDIVLENIKTRLESYAKDKNLKLE